MQQLSLGMLHNVVRNRPFLLCTRMPATQPSAAHGQTFERFRSGAFRLPPRRPPGPAPAGMARSRHPVGCGWPCAPVPHHGAGMQLRHRPRRRRTWAHSATPGAVLRRTGTAPDGVTGRRPHLPPHAVATVHRAPENGPAAAAAPVVSDAWVRGGVSVPARTVAATLWGTHTGWSRWSRDDRSIRKRRGS